MQSVFFPISHTVQTKVNYNIYMSRTQQTYTRYQKTIQRLT